MSTSDCLRCELMDIITEEYGTWDRVADSITRLNITDLSAVDWFFDPIPEGSWDGAHEQGHEGDVYMVLKYKQHFFKVSGTSNSYGYHYWSGGVKEVFPTKVVKTVYEYADQKQED